MSQISQLALQSSLEAWKHLPTGAKALGYWINSAKYAVGVLALVVDDEMRLLLAHQPYKAPKVWSLPGGCVHPGERLSSAVLREIHEETGFSVETGEIVLINELWPRRLDIYFSCRLLGGSFKPNSETDSFMFVRYPFERLPASFDPTQLEAVRALRARLARGITND